MFLNVIDTICEDYANIIIFGVNIFILLVLFYQLFFARDNRKRWNKFNHYLVDVTKAVDSVRYGDLTKKIQSLDIPNSENLTESLNRMIETLHDREAMIDEFQRDLIKQNKILERTVNSLSDGLLIIDGNFKIHRANSLITKWFDVKGKSLVGRSLFDYINIENKNLILDSQDKEITLLNDNSSSFTVSSVELNLEDEKDRILVIIKNITAQKEVETLKEDFIATLTHDLKVPIIAESNMIELFLNENFGQINDKQKQALENMQISCKELLDLVQIVLETYKLRDNKIILYKENILLKSFINEIINEMASITQKSNNQLNFILERDIRIFADKIQLKRVIKNLIQNAILYGKPNTPIDIQIGEIPDFTTIKIKDHGAGISKEQIDKIFNRYYSAGKKFRKIGTGLGLYLSKQIAKAHDGDLTVESVEGEYTEFCIEIPVNYERNTIPY